MNKDDKIKIIYTENGEDKVVSGFVHDVKSIELFYDKDNKIIPCGKMHEIVIRIYPK